MVTAVKESWSVFVAKSGIKLIAGKGNVALEAHEGQINVAADQEINITSCGKGVTVAAKESITLMAGGAKVTLQDGAIQLSCPGKVTIKSSNLNVKSGEACYFALPHLPKNELKPDALAIYHLYHDDEGVQGASFRIKLDDGSIKKGITDNKGHASIENISGESADICFEPDCRSYEEKCKIKNSDFHQDVEEMINRYLPQTLPVNKS